MKFTDGTHLLITFSDSTVTGELFLASADGFDGLLGPYDRLIPLLCISDRYRDMTAGLHVAILNVVEVTPHCHARAAKRRRHRQIPPSEVPAIANGEALSGYAD